MISPTWISLGCGLDAAASRSMTAGPACPAGRFAPIGRMGGKRGYADGVLDILGTWPCRYLMVDSDPAIVLFWRAAFEGWLDQVAEVIRSAPLDGEELWLAWRDEPVPADPVEALARWIVIQKGNFSSKPVSMTEGDWSGVAGCAAMARVYNAFAIPEQRAELTADAVAEWSGIAGYGKLSDVAVEKGFRSRIVKGATADDLESFRGGGSALLLDLRASSPVIRPGDLLIIDPPYQETTGYGDDLPRERVVELAEEGHECGARVLVHEAEPVIEGGPWRCVELPRTHGGNHRTWSKQKREVATINFEPATSDPRKHRGDRRQMRLGLHMEEG